MKKGKDLIGMPIINLSTGETVGRVRDVYFEPETHRLSGIVMDGGGWFKGARIIDFANIAGVGEDALTIADNSVIVKSQVEAECVVAGEGVVIGNKVVTRDGNELGIISDIIFDHLTGKITHYQLSEGIIQDVLEGRENISVDVQFRIGKDAVIVDL